jgi:integrase
MKKSKRVNITKRTIATLKPPATGYKLYWDDSQPGFGVRITAAGAVAFVAQGRIGTVERRITLGTYPATSPDTARKRAGIELGAMQGGKDPVAAKRSDKLAAKTLATAFAEYAELRHRSDGKPLKERTKADMDRSLKWAFASWKDKPITAITRDMVERRYQQLTAASIAQANLAMRYLRAVIGFTSERMRDSHGKAVLTDNPVRVLRRQWKAVGRRATVIEPDALGDWIPAVSALTNPVARDVLLFVALTGCRRGEALTLRKDDVDLAANAVVFKDTKNRRDHELPLTKQLAEILERRIAASPSKCEWVFADALGRPIQNLRYVQDRVQAASGVKFCVHDLRRLAATTMERAAVPVYTIKAVLNHVATAQDVTGGYVRVDNAMKLDALKKLGTFVMTKRDRRGVVVPMRKVRA